MWSRLSPRSSPFCAVAWLIAAGLVAGGLIAGGFIAPGSAADPASWRAEWPRTDFTRHAVPLADIMSGGPGKDGIPAIDAPVFTDAASAGELTANEPVISLRIGDDARAYPLRILMWHEIVNDTVGGVPVAITWCPLCNSSVVFDRRVEGRILSFGTTGKLRLSDLVMYDRETESWWQQFVGLAIVGQMTGTTLKILPARVESVARFRTRFPQGRVLVPPAGSMRNYGHNPYVGYDRSKHPFLFRGEHAGPVPPLARVVAVDGQAWTLDLLMKRRRVESGDLVITWEPGQSSPLDTAVIGFGWDIGNVVVQRRTAAGLEDEVHDVSFAFAFRAFNPDAPIHDE